MFCVLGLLTIDMLFATRFRSVDQVALSSLVTKWIRNTQVLSPQNKGRLLKHFIKDGMSEADVERLLGEPKAFSISGGAFIRYEPESDLVLVFDQSGLRWK